MNNKITKKEFLDHVKHEVETIKDLATKEEIDNLEFGDFNPNSYSRCIYGQMTGHCRTQRALNLMSKACSVLVNRHFESTDSTFRVMKKHIRGPYENNLMHPNVVDYFSALEAYILLKGSKNNHIFEYLKGYTKILKL
jgi:hypothetical protein